MNEDSMKVVSIYWNDLTSEKQAEIFALLGDNGNFDVFPIAEIHIPTDEDEEDVP